MYLSMPFPYTALLSYCCLATAAAFFPYNYNPTRTQSLSSRKASNLLLGRSYPIFIRRFEPSEFSSESEWKTVRHDGDAPRLDSGSLARRATPGAGVMLNLQEDMGEDYKNSGLKVENYHKRIGKVMFGSTEWLRLIRDIGSETARYWVYRESLEAQTRREVAEALYQRFKHWNRAGMNCFNEHDFLISIIAPTPATHGMLPSDSSSSTARTQNDAIPDHGHHDNPVSDSDRRCICLELNKEIARFGEETNKLILRRPEEEGSSSRNSLKKSLPIHVHMTCCSRRFGETSRESMGTLIELPSTLWISISVNATRNTPSLRSFTEPASRFSTSLGRSPRRK